MFPLIWFTPSDTQLLWMGNFSLWLQHRFSLLLYLKRWIPEWTKKEKGDETSGKLENWLLAHWWKYQPLDTRWHKAKVRTEAKKRTHLYILVYIYEIAVSMQFWSIWNWEGGERKIMMKGSPHSRRPLHTRASRKRRRLHCGEDSVLFSSTHSERVHFSSTSWKKKNPFSKSRSTRRSSLSKSTGKETEQVKERKRDTVNGQSS